MEELNVEVILVGADAAALRDWAGANGYYVIADAAAEMVRRGLAANAA